MRMFEQAFSTANRSRVSIPVTKEFWPGQVVWSTRLGLAIVPLCRGTGAPLRRPQAPPGPFEIFWRVRYREKFYYRCGSLPTPLVVMITLIGIPSKNSISLSDWLQLLICLHKAPDALHSKLYQTVHAKQRGRWQFACPLSHDLYIAVSVLRTTFNANI